MLTSLDHVVVRVADLAEAQRRYVALLGRSPSWSGGHPQFGTANVLFKLSNTYIELLAPAGDGPVADALRERLAAEGEGLHWLAFGTDDAEAARAELKARGLSPSEPVSFVGHDEPSGAFRRFKNVLLPPSDTRGVGLFVIEHLSAPEELPPALPLGDEAASVGGVDHVVIMTRQPEQVKRLFGEQLGLRLALDKRFEKFGSRLLFFRIGGVTVEIGAPLEDGAEQGDLDLDTDRLWGMALQVPDIEAAHARMTEAGLALTSIRTGRKPGTRVFSMKDDPLGVPTLIIEPAQR